MVGSLSAVVTVPSNASWKLAMESRKPGKVDYLHWQLWAGRKRRGYVAVGYPSREPYYQPPPAGKVWEEPREPIYDEDHAMVDVLERWVMELRNQRPAQVRCLEIYMGAYPNAKSNLS